MSSIRIQTPRGRGGISSLSILRIICRRCLWSIAWQLLGLGSQIGRASSDFASLPLRWAGHTRQGSGSCLESVGFGYMYTCPGKTSLGGVPP